MAYTLTFSYNAPPSLTMEYLLKDTSLATIEGPSSTGFNEDGSGFYGWTGNIPDNFIGWIIFRQASTSNVYAKFALNPHEIEKASLNLSQQIPVEDLTNKTTQNLGDCLSASRSAGAGRWAIDLDLNTLTHYGPNNETLRVFDLLPNAPNAVERS